MKVTSTALPEVKIIEPQVRRDVRGFFLETYNKRAYTEAGITGEFVQDNHSWSTCNVLRGLHYQIRHAQGKLVRVTSGEVLDIAVDIRRSSPTFGKYVSAVLSGDRPQVVWIPEGFAHGFLVRSASAELVYKTTDYYSPSDERTIAWDDQDLAIDWQLTAPPLLSPNDQHGVAFRSADLFD